MKNPDGYLPANERLNWSKIAAVSMVKDEGDIIGLNLEHLVRHGIKSFIIYDDGSKDNTLEEIEAVGSRHKDVKIVLVNYSNSFKKKADILNALGILAQKLFEVEWIFAFDADDFLFVAPGPRISLESKNLDYILLPWLHLQPDQFSADYIKQLAAANSVDSAIPHKFKAIVKLSNRTSIKSGQHHVINRGIRPAIGIDGARAGMASVHFPIRTKSQFYEKFAVSPKPRKIDPDHGGKHRRQVNSTGKDRASRLFDILIARDVSAYENYCRDLGIAPETYDYMYELVRKDPVSFPSNTDLNSHSL
ncbi:MAG: glycosyltransferase family 2 protein, partial [Pseudomonadota bacterium]